MTPKISRELFRPCGMRTVKVLASVGGHYWPALDGLRAIAVLLVVLYHSDIWAPTNGAVLAALYSHFAAAGWIGVRLFFVLSGFLITSLLLDTKGRPRAFRNFLVRRSLRIFPNYFVLLLTCAYILPLFGEVPPGLADVRTHLAWYATYTSNWLHGNQAGSAGLAHTWSLSVEEQFYVLFPLLILPLSRHWTALALAAMIITSIGTRILLTLQGHTAQAYMFTLPQLDALAWGAVLAMAVRSTKGRALVSRMPPILLCIPIVALAMIWLVNRSLASEDALVLMAGQTVLGVLFAMGLIVLAHSSARHGWLSAFLGSWPLVSFGRMSYALYLVHLPVVHYMEPAKAAQLRGLAGLSTLPIRFGHSATVLLASVALAFALRFLVETPFEKLKARLAPR